MNIAVAAIIAGVAFLILRRRKVGDVPLAQQKMQTVQSLPGQTLRQIEIQELLFTKSNMMLTVEQRERLLFLVGLEFGQGSQVQNFFAAEFAAKPLPSPDVANVPDVTVGVDPFAPFAGALGGIQTPGIVSDPFDPESGAALPKINLDKRTILPSFGGSMSWE